MSSSPLSSTKWRISFVGGPTPSPPCLLFTGEVHEQMGELTCASPGCTYLYISSDSCLSSSCFSWISLNHSTIRASSDSSAKETKGKDSFRSCTSSVSLAQMYNHLRETLGYSYESQSALVKTAQLWFSGYKAKGADPSLQIHGRCSRIHC